MHLWNFLWTLRMTFQKQASIVKCFAKSLTGKIIIEVSQKTIQTEIFVCRVLLLTRKLEFHFQLAWNVAVIFKLNNAASLQLIFEFLVDLTWRMLFVWNVKLTLKQTKLTLQAKKITQTMFVNQHLTILPMYFQLDFI